MLRTWIELTDDPDSYMVLMDLDDDRLPIPSTERRVPLAQYTRFVVDTQRLWHVAVHRGPAPRLHADHQRRVDPQLEQWIRSQTPALGLTGPAFAGSQKRLFQSPPGL